VRGLLHNGNKERAACDYTNGLIAGSLMHNIVISFLPFKMTLNIHHVSQKGKEIIINTGLNKGFFFRQ